MSKTYAPFHLHSTYSTLDGAGKLEDYFKRAKELGLESISISDHGNLHHVIEAYKISKKYSVKYIPGIELYQARKTRFDKDEEERAGGKASDELGQQRGPLHLSALAATPLGFRNLLKLSSDSYTTGFFVKGRVDHELIASHADGLVILSGCLNGEVNQHLLRDDFAAALKSAQTMQDIVGKDNYFIEVMLHGIPEEEQNLKHLVKIAVSIGAKIIPTIDSHYVHKEDADFHDISLCIGTGSLKADENRFKFLNDQFYLKSYQEMAKLFPDEWLHNTLELAEMIVPINLELDEFQFPVYDYDGDHYGLLQDLTFKGMRQRFGAPTPELSDRVEYELGVIRRMDFVDYILIVWDIINWCHQQGIIASARGSVAGSVIAYALGITTVDPLRFNLLFERFLIEGRKTMPDVDIDVAEDRREEVLDYIRHKYGADRVSNICNFSEIGARSAIKDCTRVLGYDYALGDKLSKLVPPPSQGFAKSLNEALESSDELGKLYREDRIVKEIIDAAKGIEGNIRQTGIHAAGVVVTPGPLTDYIPIMQKPNKDGTPGPIVTQWEGTAVEGLGLLKIDVLGLTNYMVIDRTLRYLKENKNIELDIFDIPLDDFDSYKLLQQGDTSSIFQFSSAGISRLMQDVHPDRLEDIMAVNALYRPGPLGSHMDKEYVARKNGFKPATVLHPKLEKALARTYGLMVFQEDIMAIADILAGYSVPERDDLRKLVGKKLKDEIPKARKEFVERCVSHSDISQQLGNKIFDEIEFFGAYGFNANHSCLYSYLALQTAFLKTRYPAEYMAAVISSAGDVDEVGEYVNEALRMGLAVLPPSINSSKGEFTIVSDDIIQFGLKSINGIGVIALERLLNTERGYENLYDWLRRVDPEILNKSLIEHLLYAGALDELEANYPVLISRQEKVDLLNAEMKEIGTYITEHPLEGVWETMEGNVTNTIADLNNVANSSVVTIGGIIAAKETKLSKQNRLMIFLKFQDLTGTIEVSLYTKLAEELKDELNIGDIIYVKGRLETYGEEEARTNRIILYEYSRPLLPEYALAAPIVLNFKTTPSAASLQHIIKLVERNPGDCYVHICYNVGKKKLTFKTHKPTSSELRKELEIIALGESL